MASINGHTGIGSKSGTGHYSMAKSAVISMTQTAALEYIPEQIRINVVCPTAVETDMLKAVFASNPELKILCRSLDQNFSF